MSEAIIEPPRLPIHIRHRRHLLLGITLLAAFLRFATLDRPTLWGDEALSYSRVTGTWEELFSILKTDGFMPLHYVLYWILGKYVTLTPAMMRLIPAFCGTLMVPVMYFLVRQISTVGSALLAAAFACTSSYLMRYSHDAKMYIQTWTFVAMNIGCLFWWLRTNKWVGYISWIASGIVAGGFSALALLMVLPQVFVFFSAKKLRILPAILFFVGIAVISAPVAIYMSQVNHWAERTGVMPSLSKAESRVNHLSEYAGVPAFSKTDTPGNWEESGVSWIEWYNAHSTGPTLLRASLTAYLTGWEWPVYQGTEKVFSEFVVASHFWILSFLALAGLLALFPWRKPAYFESNSIGWQRFLWIALFLVVPLYGVFYCRSVPQFNSPIEVITNTFGAIGYWSLILIAIALLSFYFAGGSINERIKKSYPWLLSILFLLVICQVMYFVMQYEHQRHWQNLVKAYGPGATPETMPTLDWKSIWMPRYVGVVIPALFAGTSMLIMRLPGQWMKGSVIAALLGFNLVSSIVRLIASPEPPMDRFMADAREVRDSRGSTRAVISTLDPRHLQKTLFLQSSWYGLYGSAGKYYASIILDLKPSPSEFRDGFLPDRYRHYLGELVDPEEIESAANQTSADLSQSPRVLIVWDHSNEQAEQPNEIPQPDRIVQILSKNWKQVGREEIFYQFDGNNWAQKGFNRRRVFERK